MVTADPLELHKSIYIGAGRGSYKYYIFFCDFLSIFSLAYFIVEIQYVIHKIYKISVNCLCYQ